VALAWIVGRAGTSVVTVNGSVVVDGPALFAQAAIVVFSLLSVLLYTEKRLDPAGDSFAPAGSSVPGSEVERVLTLQRVQQTEVYALTLFASGGMMVMVAANDLLTMFIALEVLSLPLYLLSTLSRRKRLLSHESGMKYFLLGAFASAFFLYGSALVYGGSGSLNFAEIDAGISTRVGVDSLLLVGMGMVAVGLLFKISAVPFHFWTPDVYEGAPITITAFLAVGSKAAGFALLMRFFKVTFIDTSAAALPAGTWTTMQGVEWTTILAALSVLTMTVGNLVAIWQNNLKRLLAYSSIAHAGYMLMGVVVLSNEGLAAVMLYFVVYLFMNLGAFLCVMLIADKTGSEDIEEYKGLGARTPFLSVAFTIFLVSLTGIPPTAGFVGKLYLFAAVINDGWIWLAVAGAINSVISLYYYMRIVRNMFLRPGDEAQPAITFGRLQLATILVLLVPTLLFGLYFSPLSRLAQASVQIFGTP
jgi:NADH-quinone oxidoreductase subunit N